MSVDPWPKRCKECSTEWDIDGWESLYYVGITHASKYGFDGDIEYRRCGVCNGKIQNVPITKHDVIEVKKEDDAGT